MFDEDTKTGIPEELKALSQDDINERLHRSLSLIVLARVEDGSIRANEVSAAVALLKASGYFGEIHEEDEEVDLESIIASLPDYGEDA